MSVPPRPDLRFLCAGRRANVGANVGSNFGAVAPALLRVSTCDLFALIDLRVSALMSVLSRRAIDARRSTSWHVLVLPAQRAAHRCFSTPMPAETCSACADVRSRRAQHVQMCPACAAIIRSRAERNTLMHVAPHRQLDNISGYSPVLFCHCFYHLCHCCGSHSKERSWRELWLRTSAQCCL